MENIMPAPTPTPWTKIYFALYRGKLFRFRVVNFQLSFGSLLKFDICNDSDINARCDSSLCGDNWTDVNVGNAGYSVKVWKIEIFNKIFVPIQERIIWFQ